MHGVDGGERKVHEPERDGECGLAEVLRQGGERGEERGRNGSGDQSQSSVRKVDGV